MNSHTTKRFRERLSELPLSVRNQARIAYQQFMMDPNHPGLHFERIHSLEDIWSARVGVHYRALGWRFEDRIVWFWIGTHAAYDQMIEKMRRG